MLDRLGRISRNSLLSESLPARIQLSKSEHGCSRLNTARRTHQPLLNRNLYAINLCKFNGDGERIARFDSTPEGCKDFFSQCKEFLLQ
jgi:hypothetical protein